MTAYGQVVHDMLKVLEDGPATAIEICQAIGRNRYDVSAVLTRLHKTGPRSPQRVYIQGWAYDSTGQRHYPRAVYALGNKPDKQKPKVDKAATARRWRAARNKAVNSVWALGTKTVTRKSTAVLLKEITYALSNL